MILWSCQNDKESIARVSKKQQQPLEQITKLETIYSDSGIVKVKVTAPVLNKFSDPKPITQLPKGINIEFYDDNLKPVSKLTAQYAVHYENEQKWVATQNVEVINIKGERLNTEKLIWDERTGKLTSDEFVKITTAEEIIYGNGFEANEDFSRYKIFKVKGHIMVNE